MTRMLVDVLMGVYTKRGIYLRGLVYARSRFWLWNWAASAALSTGSGATHNVPQLPVGLFDLALKVLCLLGERVNVGRERLLLRLVARVDL